MDNKIVIMEDLMKKCLKSNGRTLDKNDILKFFNVEEAPLKKYEDGQGVKWEDIIPKKTE